MGPMGFIHQNAHTMGMGQFHDGPQVSHSAEVSGVDHEDGLRGRVGLNRFLVLLQGWLIGDFQILIDFRHQIDRDGTGQNQSVDDRLMDVAGQNDRFARFAGGEDHGDDAA